VSDAADAPRPGWLGPPLWAAILRHAIPVAGVLFLGWHPLDFLLFIFLETWLFITLRAGVEATFNRSFGPVPQTVAGKVGQLIGLTAMVGVVLAGVLGLLAIVVRQFAFGDAEWQHFVEAAVWRTPVFKLGLALLLVEQVWDAARFGIRIAPLPAPTEADDRQLQRVVLRVTFLAVAAFAAGLIPPSAAAGKSLVIAMAVAMVLLEAWPEDPRPEAVTPAVEPLSASGEAAAAPRTSHRRRGRSRRG
jgi:hypothetical protein